MIGLARLALPCLALLSTSGVPAEGRGEDGRKDLRQLWRTQVFPLIIDTFVQAGTEEWLEVIQSSTELAVGIGVKCWIGVVFVRGSRHLFVCRS